MTSLYQTRRSRQAPRTVPLPPAAPIGPAVVDDVTVNLVLDLALRIGELELAAGAGAADASASILAVTDTYGLPACEVDVIATSITVCCQRGVEAAPVTTARVVRARGLDYTKLEALSGLIDRIVAGQLPAPAARVELANLIGAERRHPRWVSTLGWAGMAGALAVLLGGDYRLALIAGAVTAVVDRVGRVLNRRALPPFFQQVLGAAVVTACAVGVTASGLLPEGVRPGFVSAAGLTVLLSGLSVVGTVQDALTGFYVTAAGRAFEVAILTGGLVIGVVLALQIGTEIGVDLVIPAFPASELDDLGRQATAAGAAAAFFAMASYAPRRGVLGAGVAGAAGWTVFALARTAELSPTVASGVAAVLVGLAGRVLYRRLRLPPLVIAVSGITPLLPGFTTYHGVFELAVNDNLQGVTELLTAASIGVALAAGVVLGEYLARPVGTGLGRMERRLAGGRMMGSGRSARAERQ